MNKQELIERIEGLKNLFGNKSEYIEIDMVIRLISELDEPQKPVVPQFVADWIEEGKKHCKDVSDLFDFDFTNEEVGKWFLQEKPFDLVARAWLDGYTVEKEKRYLVKVMNIYSSSSMLKRDDITGEWFFGSEAQMFASSMIHTRKELEQAGFGWVFDCPGVEIEEVEG